MYKHDRIEYVNMNKKLTHRTQIGYFKFPLLLILIYAYTSPTFLCDFYTLAINNNFYFSIFYLYTDIAPIKCSSNPFCSYIYRYMLFESIFLSFCTKYLK